MLGMIGFIVLSAVIAMYAYTCHTNYVHVPVREKRLFIGSYSLLSLAAFIWAVALVVDENILRNVVFASEIILIVATVCMLGILVDISRLRVLLPVTLAAASIITVRAFVLPPNSYVADGLLYFNLTQAEALAFGLIFLVAWLPATITIVHLALRSPRLLGFRGVVSFLFMSVVLMTVLFLTARRTAMVVLSFSSIILMFASLVGCNIAIKRIDTTHTKHKVHHE